MTSFAFELELRRFAWLIGIAAAALSFACSSSSDDSSGGSSNALSIHVETRVESGGEIQKCQYWQMPADRGELAVGNMHHTYSAGSHHFLVYATELTLLPAGGEELVDCDELDWMSNVRGIVYAAQQPKGSFDVPKGVAQRFAPGEVVLVQTHYLNASGKPLDAQIDLEMELVDPGLVTTEAGVLFFYDPAIHLKPSSTGSAELTCPIPAESTIAFAMSHMHKRGVNFRAESSDPGVTAAVGALFETDDWSEPIPRIFPLDPPTILPAASSIKYRCDYDNTQASDVVMGFSADTNEMCMFVGMYWPRQDKSVEFCHDGRVTSTGTASAIDTIKCLVGCGGTKDAACAGPCWDQACPNAPLAMLAFTECAPDSCHSSCFIDPAGQTCANCVKPSCATEYDRLLAASCQ